MSLHLTVIGGAAAWPNPGQGCSCYLIANGSQRVLLDCGSNTLQELRKHADYTEIDAIIISHCHSDHILDLVPYRYGLVYGPKRPTRDIPVWLPPGGQQTLMDLAEAFGSQGERTDDFWSGAFEIEHYNPATPLIFGDLCITFAPTQHYVPCYAIRVSDPLGRAIVYSADTGAIDLLVDFASGATVLIVEATLSEHHRDVPAEPGHLTPSLAGQFAAQAGVDTLVLTHLWYERPDADVVRTASAYFAGRIEVAKPGLRVDV